MQVSKWLGHFYADAQRVRDYIPEEDGAVNNLPEPTRPRAVTDARTATNVVELFGYRSI
jgi:hypothetical protein